MDLGAYSPHINVGERVHFRNGQFGETLLAYMPLEPHLNNVTRSYHLRRLRHRHRYTYVHTHVHKHTRTHAHAHTRTHARPFIKMSVEFLWAP